MLSRVVIATALLWAGAVSAGEFDPATGYRIDRYRAPVDRPLEGGAVAGLDEVDRLVAEDGAALIDVMPARAGYDHATGRWLIVEKRENLPGSVWLPEVGRGALEPCLAPYFEASLRRLTADRSDRPLVFYCMADCWMSWNAVRRAAALGFRRLYWFPEGTDGWRDAGRPFASGDPWPVPGPEEARSQRRMENLR